MEYRTIMTRCEVCDTHISSTKLLFEKENIRKTFPKGPFQLVQCVGCGIVFVSNPPPPEDLKLIYSSSYYNSGQQSDILIDSSAVRKNAIERLNRIMTYRSHGNLLDVGCGTGIFLDVAKTVFKVSGVEVSPHAVITAKKRFGLHIHHGDFVKVASLSLKGQLFDIITLWDVIGHLPSPRSCLEHIYFLLKPGGLLIMTTGDINSMLARLLERRWHLATPPEILFYFSKRSISSLLNRTGFDVLCINKPGKFVSLDFIAGKLRRLYGWSWPERIMHNLPWRKIYINLFDIMTVSAQRPHL